MNQYKNNTEKLKWVIIMLVVCLCIGSLIYLFLTGRINKIKVYNDTIKDITDKSTNVKTEPIEENHVIDKTKPIITITGKNEVTINIGGTYTEVSAAAWDNIDGNITSKIIVTGRVDATKEGTYIIHYNVSDSSGNAADEVNRTVHVIALAYRRNDYCKKISAGFEHKLAIKADGTVMAWGYSKDGEINVPIGLNNVVQVAAGLQHSLALKSDGTVIAWGNNDDGQTNVPADLKGVIAISAGYYHNLALKPDGTVVAWGNNECGETNVPANLNGVVAIAAGAFFNLALKSDGTVVAWGDNYDGQTNLPEHLNGVIAIYAGGEHCIALKTDGTYVAWGLNNIGQANIPKGL